MVGRYLLNPVRHNKEQTSTALNGSSSRRFRRALSALCVLCVLCIPSAHARVFQRLGGARKITAVLQQIGGRTAYKSDITLNGGDARLTIVGMPGAIKDVARSLQGSLGKNAFANTSGGLLRTKIKEKSGTTRILLIHLPSHAQTLAFLVEQSTSEAERTDRGEVSADIPGVALFPDSVPHFSAQDKRANVTFNVLQTSASLDTVQAWHESELSRSGWALMAPPTAHATGGMQVFSRGRDMCCVTVNTVLGTKENTITLLHKKPGIE